MKSDLKKWPQGNENWTISQHDQLVEKMAAPIPIAMSLDVPAAGNVSFSIEIRKKLAERAAYWRKQWQQEERRRTFGIQKEKKMLSQNQSWVF